MNDFTKEELQDLYDDIWTYDYKHRKPPDYILAIREKLQSMIENYCEHEEKILERPRMNIHMGKCKKCGIKL